MRRWLIVALALVAIVPGEASPARLTAHDRAQGWRLLFDGTGFSGWHSFGARRVAPNWAVGDGTLEAREEGRALATDELFGDFELSFSWRVVAGGRAEVFFRASEDAELPAHSAPVFQLAGPDADCGGNGGIIAPETAFVPAPDVWHHARLVVAGDQVEHWVGERLLLSYRLGSAEWRAALPASRFANFRGYGRERRGAIALAGRGAMFRDLKVRPL